MLVSRRDVIRCMYRNKVVSKFQLRVLVLLATNENVPFATIRNVPFFENLTHNFS